MVGGLFTGQEALSGDLMLSFVIYQLKRGPRYFWPNSNRDDETWSLGD